MERRVLPPPPPRLVPGDPVIVYRLLGKLVDDRYIREGVVAYVNDKHVTIKYLSFQGPEQYQFLLFGYEEGEAEYKKSLQEDRGAAVYFITTDEDLPE